MQARTAPVLVADLFPAERAALLEVLGGLDERQWATPTLCPAWSVKDVVCHLLGNDLGLLSRSRDGFDAGRVDDDLPWAAFVAALGSLNQSWVDVAGRFSTRVLCELLAFTGSLVDTYVAGVEPEGTGETVSWAGTGAAPNWLCVARELSERWTHQQQVREAVGRPGLKEARFLGPVLDTFVRALPHTYRYASSAPGTSLRLTITGDAGGTWLLVRDEDAWHFAADAPGPPTTEVTLDQETAWRLFARAIGREDARSRTTVTGNVALGILVLDTVAIIA